MAANAAAISPPKRRRTAAATPPKPAKALDSVAKVHDLLRGEAVNVKAVLLSVPESVRKVVVGGVEKPVVSVTGAMYGGGVLRCRGKLFRK